MTGDRERAGPASDVEHSTGKKHSRGAIGETVISARRDDVTYHHRHRVAHRIATTVRSCRGNDTSPPRYLCKTVHFSLKNVESPQGVHFLHAQAGPFCGSRGPDEQKPANSLMFFDGRSLARSLLMTRRRKNPHAMALGRLGGLKGGRARAEKLSARRRREIARQAAIARWNNAE